jgi:4-hydroxythreonine-4-phosphate dehydrogenase
MGDPAGIGPEICLAMLDDAAVLAECTPVIFGSAALLNRVADQLGRPRPRVLARLEEGQSGVLECGTLDAAAVQPAQISAACGQASFDYIDRAVIAALQGEVAAIATAPINKEALRAAGVPYPGHTEILGALTKSPRVCMMLASDVLTVSMVTTHIGLNQVPGKMTKERVLDVIELTDAAIAQLRGERKKIGVCGLNPHAGENGLFGNREEETAIQPAIEEAKRRGIDADGPIPPDTAFVPNRARHYGAIVCMYHDQGHIPFKMLAFDTGVNITLGLPIVRVSVDHGTAFDIAWQGKADLTSMRQAVLYAARMGMHRRVAA